MAENNDIEPTLDARPMRCVGTGTDPGCTQTKRWPSFMTKCPHCGGDLVPREPALSGMIRNDAIFAAAE